MADADKRPGSRDISDLKARLGLKKGGPAAKKGVVPPPGTRGGAVPPPPGVEPARPKASDDPFGALNAAANRPAPAPEIIIVERGGPVESVERKAAMLKFAKIGGIVLVPLILGVVIGQIASKGKQYNRVIEDSGRIAAEINKSRKSISAFELVFKKNIADRKELVDALDKIKYDPPNTEVVYKSWLYELDPELVGQTLQYVMRAAKLATDIRAHIDQTKKDFDLLKKGSDAIKAAQPKETENRERYSDYRFAILLSIPSEEEQNQGKKFGAQFVEIDMPICNDTNQASPTYECTDKPSGFRYRADPGSAWKDGQLANPGAVAGDKLIPLLPSSVVDVLAKQSGPTLAELRYNQRVIDLATQTGELVQTGTYIEGQLEAKSRETKRFTFFL